MFNNKIENLINFKELFFSRDFEQIRYGTYLMHSTVFEGEVVKDIF